MISLASKDLHDLKKNDLVVFRFGGGAGYGAPEDRASEEIEDDIRQGMLSVVEAERAYPGKFSTR